LFVTIHHDRGGRSATPGTTTCASTCANDLKVSNYRCRNCGAPAGAAVHRRTDPVELGGEFRVGREVIVALEEYPRRGCARAQFFE
jgi:hypothetical protein